VSADTVLGRDPAAGVCIDDAEVSWAHAVIREDGDRHTIADLGSTNGTLLNGAPVREPLLLSDGDRIEVGSGICFLYEIESEEPREGRWRPNAARLGAFAVVLIATAAALAYWVHTPERSDPVLEKATELAREGLTAARRGDASSAKTHLQSAIGELYRNGRLDHVTRAEVPRQGMNLLSEQIGEGVDLWTIFNDTLRSSRPKPPIAKAAGECRLDSVEVRNVETCLRERLESVLIGLRQDATAIPPDFHREVGTTMKLEHDFLARSLERGRPLIPMLRRQLEDARMPPLLHYVALIESGYQNTATSVAQAAGLWQLMPDTARQYGLSVGSGRDDRRDPEKSTQIAARYLRDLAFEFGGDALLLALTGYNRGENGVRRALKKLDDPFSDRSYWRLVERQLIPEETAHYVPRFLAAAVAGEAGLPSAEALEAAGY
jgi:hypothetical protein